MKPYLATNALEPSLSFRTRIFNTLVNLETYKDICRPYLSEPAEWDYKNHPIWQEPCRLEELHLWTKNLYGVESLGRVLLAQHPARNKEIYMYIAMDRDFVVPVLTDCSEPDVMEEYLAAKLKPFYKHGYGKVICPVCLFRVAEEIFIPREFSRAGFCRHFCREHHRNIGVLGLGFATQYHCRMLQAQIIYHFSLASMSERDEDHVTRGPLAHTITPSESFQVENRHDIQEMLINCKQEHLLKPESKAKMQFGWSEQPDEDRRPPEEEDPPNPYIPGPPAVQGIYQPASASPAALNLGAVSNLQDAVAVLGLAQEAAEQAAAMFDNISDTGSPGANFASTLDALLEDDDQKL